MTGHTFSPPPADFSIVLGGPLYQLLRRAHLSDDALALVNRRIVAGVLITWLPLSVVDSKGGIKSPTRGLGCERGGGVEAQLQENAEINAEMASARCMGGTILASDSVVHGR